MKPVPRLDPSNPLPTSATVFEYFVVVGFADHDGAVCPLEITYVADYGVALSMAQEDEPSLDGVSIFRLEPCSEGMGYRRPQLVHSAGSLPEGWNALPKDFLFNV